MLESDCQIGMVRHLMREADKERERESGDTGEWVYEIGRWACLVGLGFKL